MRSHSIRILCDSCGRSIADEAAKEVVYQVGKLRYRLELCASCLSHEMERLTNKRWIPGFRKRVALSYVVDSEEELPRRRAA